jgi:hypothetical protein
MGERGSSIPTLCSFLSQGRLEVEEVKKREPFPSRRREMEKNKRPASLGKGLLLSLLSNKGSMLHQCSGSNQEREREREVESVHAQQVCGSSMRWVPILLLTTRLLMWLSVPVLCLPMQVEEQRMPLMPQYMGKGVSKLLGRAAF